ncbi:hypothetical protein [Nonomuraea cavernae]
MTIENNRWLNVIVTHISRRFGPYHAVSENQVRGPVFVSIQARE